MFKLLGTDIPKHYSKLSAPNWGRISEIMNNGIKEAKDYYQNHKQFTLSGHPLITYLQYLPVSINLPYFEYASNILSIGIEKTRLLRFTSSLSAGEIHTNVFYGNGSKEIIIAVNSQPRLSYVKEHWKEMNALRVVRHPYSHLFYQTGENGPISRTKGLSIVIVDVTLLALQYKCFYDEQVMQTRLNGGIPLEVTNFIRMYVLPSLTESNLNNSILNRFICKNDEISPSANTFRTPFVIPELNREIDNITSYMCRVLSNTGRTSVEVLSTIPTINGNMTDHLTMTPQVLLNRQNTWAYFTAMLPALNLAYSLGGKKAVAANSREINRIIDLIRKLENDRVFQQNNLNLIKPIVELEIEGIRQTIAR